MITFKFKKRWLGGESENKGVNRPGPFFENPDDHFLREIN